MREMPSAIDLEQPPLGARALGWTSAVLAVATVLLLLANAVSLRDWIDDLPPGPVQQQASVLAGEWADASEALGIGMPRKWLHERWKSIEAARF